VEEPGSENASSKSNLLAEPGSEQKRKEIQVKQYPKKWHCPVGKTSGREETEARKVFKLELGATILKKKKGQGGAKPRSARGEQ